MADRSAELLIVTGMSGAGRSTVGNALEDIGWYVIDNVPPQLLGPINDLFAIRNLPLRRVAVIIDARGGEFFGELSSHLDALRMADVQLRLLFLEASDAALVRRFESVRRPHPLQGDGTILQGIASERQLLLPLRESADLVLDTSDLNVHQLTAQIAQTFAIGPDRLNLNIVSFGFKYGLPQDADWVIDARFITNPHWDENLRPLTGNDATVADFVLNQNMVAEFLEHYRSALRPVLAGYLRENKRFVTIAIGCTGGKHRSVAIANELANRLSAETAELRVSVRHRDLGRE
ncbi:MAG: hypothetical protein RL198_192 [Actinomycetota bacterium]